jgi:hypothetical protein
VSAQVNLSTNAIAISGSNFGNQLPEVSLDATSLVVTAFGPAKIQANLPVGLVLGSYRLVVTAGGASHLRSSISHGGLMSIRGMEKWRLSR